MKEVTRGLEKKYEALVVVSCKIGGDNVSSVIEKLKKLVEDNAALSSVDEWGKRKLSYPINKENEAYYVLFTFVSGRKFPEEFIRICRITDGIIRAMVTGYIEKKDKKHHNFRARKGERVLNEPSSDVSSKINNGEVKVEEPESSLDESDGRS